MAGDRRGSLMKTIGTLLRSGPVGALTDTELLDRFLARGDLAEEAFEALVLRHGPMVMVICRGILENLADGEDAFQATFLILARCASSVRRKASVGCWLHGVARRVALRARADMARRRRHETRAAGLRPVLEASATPIPDLDNILHEELGRLPEKYRAPVMLCDVEGLPHESAARRLGWPVGTVSGRLSRARGLLRSRLRRRGLEPGSIITGTVVVPATLTAKTSRAAAQFASMNIRTAARLAHVGAERLAEGVLAMTSLTNRLILTAGAGLAATTLSFLAVKGQAVGQQPVAEPTKAASVPSKDLPKAAREGEALKTIREAEKVADAISSAGVKVMMLVNVAEAYAGAGYRDQARAAYQAALQALDRAPKREEAALGRDERRTLVPVRRPNPHPGEISTLAIDQYLTTIANSQAENGFVEEAGKTMEKLGDASTKLSFLVQIAYAMAQGGRIEDAVQIVGRLEESRPNRQKSHLLANIAHIQAKDYPNSDRGWVDKLTDPADKSRVLLGVAAGQSGQAYTSSQFTIHGR